MIKVQRKLKGGSYKGPSLIVTGIRELITDAPKFAQKMRPGRGEEIYADSGRREWRKRKHKWFWSGTVCHTAFVRICVFSNRRYICKKEHVFVDYIR